MSAARLYVASDARRPWWGLLLAAVFVLFAVGCGSDRSSTTTGQGSAASGATGSAQAKKQRQPDFEFFALSTRPTDYELTVPHVKPGHWIEASQMLVANHGDLSGELEVEPILLPGVPFTLGMSRAAVLAKSQIKSIPLTLYATTGANRPAFTIQLRDSVAGRVLLRSPNPVVRLAPHQFFFTVLTLEPDRFRFLRDLDCIVPPTNLFLRQGEEAHYRVMTPIVTHSVSLPTHFLASTAVAYVLWDDVDPAVLTADQQTALLDWIHWGGQLIVNGPQTLDTLKGSFLARYLPADGDGVVELPVLQVNQVLNEVWSTGSMPLLADADWPAQRLIPREDSRTLLEIGDLPVVVERRVGRGRIVATAFSLARRELVVWPDFDGFFNAAILRREPRTFGYDDTDTLSVWWGEEPPQVVDTPNDADARFKAFDPSKNSQLRLFSRDPDRKNHGNPSAVGPISVGMNWGSNQLAVPPGNENEAAFFGGWKSWDLLAQQVRQSLISAAGIDVPNASFVLWLLVAYLIVLVPVNWATFRALGRVEWAWLAAPVITIVFAVAVVKLARLNIGFARAQTEIGILELQDGYNRAHVTRYTALYTSLGTNYELEFEDRGALAQPFPVGRQMLAGQRLQNLQLRRTSVAKLTGFSVASNSLGMLHTEEMFTCEGSLQLSDLGSAWRIENNTGLNLLGVGIFAPGRTGWIDELAGNATVTVPCEVQHEDLATGPRGGSASPVAQLISKIQAAADVSADGLNVLNLINLAVRDGSDAKETLLVALLDTHLPGVTITPQSDQDRSAMLVLAYLDYQPRADARTDRISRAQAELTRNRLPGYETLNFGE